MKPSELFPGAVTAQGVVADALCDSVVLTDGRTELYDSIAPLPISPAVLRGLGFQQDEYGLFRLGNLSVRYSKADAEWYATMYQRGFASPKHTHQLQALSLHLYGVELTWNQEEYEKAMKEDAK